MFPVHLASNQGVKIEVTERFFSPVYPHKVSSGVSEQPFGREEIFRGVKNRVDSLPGVLPVIAFETGIISKQEGKEYYDVTCCMLRTHLGDFISYVSHQIKTNLIHTWAKLQNRSNITFGSMFAPDTPNDWYVKDNPEAHTRATCMARAVMDVCSQYTASMVPYIDMKTHQFKGVDYIDIQSAANSGDLIEAVKGLASGLLFNKVIFPESRGFLFLGAFRGYDIVLARKPEKLPGPLITATYTKEYGTDSISIREGDIKPKDLVLVVDDVIATGGTMRAIESLVKMSGGSVVGFLAPYALENKDGSLMCGNLTQKCRYLSKKPQAPEYRIGSHPNVVNILPPSLKSYSSEKSAVSWRKFAHSSDLWIDSRHLKHKIVRVFLNTLRSDEMCDVKAVIDILHRKDAERVEIVVPFMEHATQDIVMEKNGMESIAQVDTMAKFLGNNTVYTFDIHNKASRFAFYDLRELEIVRNLWEVFHEEYPAVIPVFPDEGAAKRFGSITGKMQHVTFSKIRQGEQRLVHTTDTIAEGNYVIIDDMIRSGGTMNAVAEYLKKHGAKNVYGIFAHFCAEKNTARNITELTDIWCSDSCGNVPREFIKIRVLDVLDSTLE